MISRQYFFKYFGTFPGGPVSHYLSGLNRSTLPSLSV
jgi:hypothetical protein